MKHLAALDDMQLHKLAPSIFAEQPWDKVSKQYTFIPTIDVVNGLRREGFYPVKAAQSRTRIEGKGEFTKHMLRFVHINRVFRVWELHAEVPEVVLVNSNDRSSGFQLSAGVFRLVCLNGLTVKSASFGDISVRHSGDIASRVIEGAYSIVKDVPAIMAQVDTFKSIQLSAEQQYAFSEAALELRYPKDAAGNNRSPIKHDGLLLIRRGVDAKNDLWTVFNRVQENFMRGGLRGIGTTGRVMRTHKIASVNEDLRLNKALWLLTEKMAALAP